MDFKAFTDQLLAASISTQDIAEALGVQQNTVLRARMDPANPNSRNAPSGWEGKLRALALERGHQLLDLGSG